MRVVANANVALCFQVKLQLLASFSIKVQLERDMESSVRGICPWQIMRSKHVVRPGCFPKGVEHETDRFRVKRNNSYFVEGAGIAIVSGGRERKSQGQERRTCDKICSLSHRPNS